MNKSANSKLFNFIAVVLFSLEMFSAGANFADNEVTDGVISLVLAAFWGGLLLIEWIFRGKMLKLYEKLEKKTDEIFKDMGKIVDEAENKEPDYLGELIAITERIGAGKKPTKAMGPKIEKAFHEKFPDRWLRLTLNKNGKFDAEVSNHPFGPVKKTPAKKPTKKAPAKKASKK